MAEKEPSLMPFAVGKITVATLQKMKDEGTLITMVGTGPCDALWVLACERAGVELVRYVAFGENCEDRARNLHAQTREIRKLAPMICLNAVMSDWTYADKYHATEVATKLMMDGADCVLPMGVTNETLKYMSDRCIPVFGHVGCLSGWQAKAYGGYKRIGKTASEAMDVFRMAYEYQENGMVGMTIEMTSREVTEAIAKKLRVPVIAVAAGGAADGSEMVIYDLLGFQPVSTMAKHSKHYRTYLEDSIAAFKEFDTDIKTRAYPQKEHGWSMDERELEKFLTDLDNTYK
ncbi:MAG: 3-methyl-2-oxobutanoate hydroxymethyltransferase [Coriobacteriales bacterium]|jgi:3-methyl-2-oxobutanoate hydroxymethyltransferase|nr:3-methyl-2-oxobutanoate hydroxymethyltransferase [Coriobacteriales bacterium]